MKLIQADGKDGENGASKRTRILAKLVSDHLETEDLKLSGAKDTIELAFGLKKSIKEFKDLKKELVAEKQIQRPAQAALGGPRTVGPLPLVEVLQGEGDRGRQDRGAPAQTG